MRHIAYPKIERTQVGMTPPGGDWVVLEKVHGAQIVVGADAREVRVGKRKAWLAPSEVFFGWQRLRSDLEAQAVEVRGLLGVERVRLYGELCGEGVQTGVHYGDALRVLWFDVLINDREFMSHRELASVIHECNVVPLLRRGPRTALEDVPVLFETRVPGGRGVAEGWVKKPDRRMPLNERYAIKRKIPELDESGGIYGQAVAFDPDAEVPFETLVQWARRMVNPARIASARSKVGDVGLSDEVALDVMADLEAAWPAAMGRLSVADSDSLVQQIRKEMA